MQFFDYNSSLSIVEDFPSVQFRGADRLDFLAENLLEKIALDLDPVWGSGRMSAAAYDTAWVAMVRSPHDPENRLAFPQAFEWLLNHQASDGSWSDPLPYSLLPTLAGLLALLKAPAFLEARTTQRVQQAIRQAHSYLRLALQQWAVNAHESVGFEVLAPALLNQLAEEYDIHFEFEGRGQLMALYRQKLLIAGPDLIYSGQSNLIHSLEAFGSSLDFARLKSQQAANGSYGCSPAATAAVLVYGPQWDQKAADWLAHLSQDETLEGAMPNAYPIDAFEAAWVVYNLAEAGLLNLPQPQTVENKFRAIEADDSGVFEQLLSWLYHSLSEQGASISELGGMPRDSDDTGMVLAALHMADPSSLLGNTLTYLSGLLRFEREHYYACFELERGASLSANAHVLAAWLSLPASHRVSLTQAELDRIDQGIAKVTKWLLAQRNPNGFWEDKWHLSRYYATACSVLALSCHSDPTVRANLEPTLNWLLETQSGRDGGWGTGGFFSTLEESAYAIQSLKAILRSTASSLAQPLVTRTQAAIEKGKVYLEQHLEALGSLIAIERTENEFTLPKLWRGKELYSPERVVLSAVLSALSNN